MGNRENKLINLHTSEASRVALKVFFRISHAWQLNEEQELSLLGATFRIGQNEGRSSISDERLERISYVLGIYKSLRAIFPTEVQANAWIKKPNDAFNGETAIDVMIREPSEVRRYLDYQLQA